MQKLFKSLGSLIVMAVALGLIIVTPYPAQADVVGPEECFPAVLMLRGSGEVLADDAEYNPASMPDTTFIETNRKEGGTISRLLQAFVNQTDPAKTVSKVRFIGMNYPALDVEPPSTPVDIAPIAGGGDPAPSVLMNSVLLMNHIVNYDDSFRDGAKEVVNFIKADERSGCNTQYMLVGYSQGVIAARLAISLMDNNTDKIISSYVLGDPFQKASGSSALTQRTIANTSHHTSGVGPLTLSVLGTANHYFTSFYPDFGSTAIVSSIQAYVSEMSLSNPTIYRNNQNSGIVSRSLCHANDPVCGIDLANLGDVTIDSHTDYFDSGEQAGSIDLDYEIEEFDLQVQTLANSTTANPRARTLTKTPSFIGGTTTYNIANARWDDVCAWDIGSDSVVDYTAICEPYDVTHIGDPNMTVTVTDSFSIQETFASNTTAIDPTPLQGAVDEIVSLDPNAWYQFKAYKEATEGDDDFGYQYESCIEVWQSYSSLISSMPHLSKSHDCIDYNYASAVASNAGEVFKYIEIMTPQGPENRMLWGYDDHYSWELDSYPQVNIKPTSNSSSQAQNVKAELAFFIENIPYYKFRFNSMECITSGGYGMSLEICDTSDLSQLFSATKIDKHFGGLSIERDVTPPTNVTGLHVSINGSNAKLEWNSSEDSRQHVDEYKIFLKNSLTNAEMLVATESDKSYSLNLNNMIANVDYTYRVVAVDYAGLESVDESITIQKPVLSALIPPAPILLGTDYNAGTVTIGFENFGNPVTRVRLWERNSFREVVQGDVYIDTETPRGQVSIFRYQVEIAPNIYSQRSVADLTVRLTP